MSIPPSIIPAKKRVRRKRRAESPAAEPPPSGNRILSVVRDPSSESPTLVVTLSQPAVDVHLPEGFGVYLGGLVGADNVDVSNPLAVRFIFLEPIDPATQWAVLDPSAWTFADSETLLEPFEGEIG